MKNVPYEPPVPMPCPECGKRSHVVYATRIQGTLRIRSHWCPCSGTEPKRAVTFRTFETVAVVVQRRRKAKVKRQT